MGGGINSIMETLENIHSGCLRNIHELSPTSLACGKEDMGHFMSWEDLLKITYFAECGSLLKWKTLTILLLNLLPFSRA